MKASRFNMLVPHEPTDELLLFNTSSGSLIAVDSSDEQALTGVVDGVSPISGLSDELREVLFEQGYLIDDDLDEIGMVVERNQLGIDDPNRLDVFILPNMNCNFACPYCFEDHRPSQMSDETVERIIAWLERMAPQFKVVLISWFGGEPLLSFTRMIEVQRRLKSICERVGTTFNSHVTTNGYLLDEQRAAQLADAGLLSYQITMDGPPEIHNRRRLLKGPGDSFERVFANLCALARNVPDANIKLRVNFDPSTLPSVPELLTLFPEDVRSRLHLVLEKIFGDDLIYIGWSRERVAKETEECYELARRLGYQVTTTPLEPTKLTYCYADRKSEFVFNHEGDVFKCTVSNFTAAERLGVLVDGGGIQWEGSGLQDWMALPSLEEKCHACTYLPMCMGGCRKSRQQTGSVGDDCTLPFAALETRIRHRYEAELVNSP